ncbi:MAG: leucine-rich repeat domain-containing protein [Spirochaetaceae bacterium]|nr:leucine-rich repeat domain-containing protein [Spirochaetaceae bacterium]
MTNKKCLKVAAIMLIAVLVFAGCSGKKEGGGRPTPASDFSYELTADGRGIVITRYTGRGGAVVIPSTIEGMPVLVIGRAAFRGRSSTEDPRPGDAVTTVFVPSSVEWIRGDAFAQMENLTKVTLSEGLKIIDINAFASNRRLTTINLPATLEELGAGAFSNCRELSELSIPESLRSIRFISERHQDGTGTVNPNNFAFLGCQKLPLRTRQTIESWGYSSGF